MTDERGQPKVLGFASADRVTSLPASGPGSTQRAVSYDDFTVDGVRLFKILFAAHKPDDVTLFDAAWPEGAVKEVDELLGTRQPELDDGRVPLYVCAECADLGCGALTAEIERIDDLVIWKNFGWQNDYEDGWEVGEYQDLSSLAPITFERGQYERVLQEARDRYVDMPRTPPPEAPTAPVSLMKRLVRRFRR